MLVFVFLASMPVYAQAQRSSALDSVEVGLITCSPHDEVYSLYGHTALHCRDLRTGRDYVFNYGVFDYKKPHFVWRFIMGQTDYMLECISDLQAFCSYYKRWGSQVKEQILDLTPTEKARLVSALGVNLQNPVYRYNYFYDNCSTRPRDMIERCLEGTVSYAAREGFEDATYRQLIHLCTEEHPWAELGNDLLLGFRADRKTTQRERHFLPEFLSWDFDHATVTRQGEARPLVSRQVILIPQGNQPVKREFPLSPLACTLIFIIISLAVLAYELRYGVTLVWWDVLLMLVTGLAGILLFLMLFSEHPATSTNLQILVLNPLALFFIPAVVRKRKTRWFLISGICIFAFLLGGFIQNYPIEMDFVALCLLLRVLRHRYDK